ncbi:MAG: TadE/TadG family type IV pilus assembly protein [Myxococcota bacterium]
MTTDRRGSHTIELALVLPVLLALLTGVFDYGWVILHRNLAADAADTGARAGAMASSEQDAVALAEAAAAERWVALRLPTSPTIAARTVGDRIEVAFTLADVRPVRLVPGPEALTVVRSRRLEDDP